MHTQNSKLLGNVASTSGIVIYWRMVDYPKHHE